MAILTYTRSLILRYNCTVTVLYSNLACSGCNLNKIQNKSKFERRRLHKVYIERYIIRYQHYETRDMTSPSPPHPFSVEIDQFSIGMALIQVTVN